MSNEESNYDIPGNDGGSPQATHIALDLQTAKSISTYFETTDNLTWAEANPFVMAIAGGVRVAIEIPETANNVSPIKPN